MLHSLPIGGTVVVLLTLTIIYLSLKKFFVSALSQSQVVAEKRATQNNR